MSIKEDILIEVAKPSRYLGLEVNSIRKDPNKIALKIALTFPDVYEVGMSYLGWQILYSLLNEKEDIMAERVYAPWPDLGNRLKETGITLCSLESGLSLKEFDIVGFTLQYELSYTNIFYMLHLAKIPFYSNKRDRDMPLIIAGGPCSFNPEPIAPIFDAIVIGDGEEVILEICDLVKEKKNLLPKKELLSELSKLEGVYIPSFFKIKYRKDGSIKEIIPLKEKYQIVKKRAVLDLDKTHYPIKQIVPITRIIHDRLGIEIARGCTRGCRFCQAGIIYRPVRERSKEKVVSILKESLKETGYEEISLSSLSVGDYSGISDLLREIIDKLSKENISLSLPSLRVKSISDNLLSQIKKVRSVGFTIAPEAGSQRLRNLINKNLNEAEILDSAEKVFLWGFNSLKLYFLIGLPSETYDDLVEIVNLVRKILSRVKVIKGRKNITVNISNFVPKSHTPFQWTCQLPKDEILRRQQFLRDRLKPLRIKIKWQDHQVSEIEGVFARGDRRLSRILEKAYMLGCYFDGWTEFFKYGLWQEALSDVDFKDYLFSYNNSDFSTVFPWDHIYTGVKKDYLWGEYKKSLKSELTPDCRACACNDCGLCGEYSFNKAPSLPSDICLKEEVIPIIINKERDVEEKKVRFCYEKKGRARFLSHLEVIGLLHRAIKKTGIKIIYSKGFHPLPRFSFSQALPVGVESNCEYFDIKVEATEEIKSIAEKINRYLIKGIKIISVDEIGFTKIPLSDILLKYKYLIFLDNLNEDKVFSRVKLQNYIDLYNKVKKVPFFYTRKDKSKLINLKDIVSEIKINDNNIEIVVDTTGRAVIRPKEVLLQILHFSPKLISKLRILKTTNI
jgi:radical SAM family uncharacterized protein/radical SAM-linked protein